MGDGFLVEIGLGVEVGNGAGLSIGTGETVGELVPSGVEGVESISLNTLDFVRGPRKNTPSIKRIIIEPIIMYLISRIRLA